MKANNKVPSDFIKGTNHLMLPKGGKKQFPSKFEDIKTTNNAMNNVVKAAANESRKADKNKNPYKYDVL